MNATNHIGPDPVLAAAAALFEEHGYEKVSVEAIAARAGFARSTVFARYATKEKLLAGIVRSFLRSFPAFLARFGSPAQTPVAPGPADEAPPPAGGAGEAAAAAAGVDAAGAPRTTSPLDARMLLALRAFSDEFGAVARVALAAKDLPWVRSLLDDGSPSPYGAFRECLGPAGDDPLLTALAMDVLKHVCMGFGPATHDSVIDLDAGARLLALVHMWAPALGRGARAPDAAF